MATISFPAKKGSLPIQQNKPVKEKMTGLGDLVAIFAQPIKETILKHGPSIITEQLRNCHCEERQQKLNQMFPFK